MKWNVTQLLRRPKVIVGEIAAVGFVSGAGVTLPLLVDFVSLRQNHPMVVAVCRALGFDNLIGSLWFLIPLGLAGASLTQVVYGQLRRLPKAWSRVPTAEHFRSAPFRAEFERPARASSPAGTAPTVEIRTSGRIAVTGSPVFHVGLLLVVAAGLARALFGSSAAVDLVVGEALPPGPAAWNAQWPGYWAGPIALRDPLTLESVSPALYPDGSLMGLAGKFSSQGPNRMNEMEIAVNSGVVCDGTRLYVASNFGPAGMIEWPDGHGGTVCEAVLMSGPDKGVFKGSSAPHGGMRVKMHAQIDSAGKRPTAVDVRVMRGDELVYSGAMNIKQSVVLPDGTRLKLRSIPYWMRLFGSRDSSLPLVYAGFCLVLLGSVIIFGVVRVETLVLTTPAGDTERIVVALTAQRLAPLYEERFANLVRTQGGEA